MPRNPPRLPITPATVTIDGSGYGSTNPIWSHLRLNEGVTGLGWSSRDHVLRVPSCHPNDNIPSDDCGFVRLRAQDKYKDYRFVRQRSGAWMLVLGEVAP